MKHRQEAWLNGVALTSAHPAILLQHIEEPPPRFAQKTMPRPYGGTFLTSNVIERREVNLIFAIRERFDYAARMDALQAVSAWAASGGVLELSDHPNQALNVDVSALPGIGKLREWTADLSLTLTAYAWPYWMDKTPARVSRSTASGTAQISVGGTMQTALEASITPTGGALTAVSLSTGDDTITLSGINVPVGTALEIAYNAAHTLTISAGGVGLLQYRTGADDLRLAPGVQTITFEYNTACDSVFKARGCWV